MICKVIITKNETIGKHKEEHKNKFYFYQNQHLQI